MILLLWYCLRCCGCLTSFCSCCCSRSGGRKRGRKHIDDRAAPGPYAGGYRQAPQHPIYEPQHVGRTAEPQFATFDAHGPKASHTPVNEDSLPAMPSWDTARSRKTLVMEDPPKLTDDVELGHLNPTIAQRAASHQFETGPPVGSGTHEVSSSAAGDLGSARINHDGDYTELPATQITPSSYGRGALSGPGYAPPRSQDVSPAPYGSPTGYRSPTAYGGQAAHSGPTEYNSPTGYVSPAAYGGQPPPQMIPVSNPSSAAYGGPPAQTYIPQYQIQQHPTSPSPARAPSPAPQGGQQYAAYSPYTQQQSGMASHQHSAAGHGRPPGSAGKPAQETWTVI